MGKPIKGTVDLIKETYLYKKIEDAFFKTLKKYNYTEIRTPLLEPESLFKRSVGESSDIVQKEMFYIEDNEDKIVLRPEGTAPVVRALVNSNLSSPYRLSYIGPMFRKERPQKGRLRQFNQYGFEIFGETSPSAEIETLLIVIDFYKSLNFSEYEIQCNYLGNNEDRENYKKLLISYLTPYKESLSEDSQKRLSSNVLRILDSKNQNDQKILENAPQILDSLNESSKKEWAQILELANICQIPLKINQSLVRGLDYYCGFVFEVIDKSGNLGSQSALGGGGRYDGLVKAMSGPDTPSFGFGGGIERLLLALNDKNEEQIIDVGFIYSNKSIIPQLIKLKEKLIFEGLSVDLNLNYSLPFKKQFKRLDKIKCKKAIIIGESELAEEFVKIKNLETGEEYKTLISFEKLKKSDI